MPGFSWPVSVPGSPTQTTSGVTVTFLGAGLLSPLREDPVTGDFQRVSGNDNVAQCVRDGILTALGERVMNEGLGTITRDMLFEESEVISDLLPPSIKDFVDRYEPRILLTSVTAKPVSATVDRVDFVVKVIYIVRATNTKKNLVVPFALTPNGG